MLVHMNMVLPNPFWFIDAAKDYLLPEHNADLSDQYRVRKPNQVYMQLLQKKYGGRYLEDNPLERTKLLFQLFTS